MIPKNKKLTPHFIQLTQDACLKAFWRRKALHIFLKQHRIADATLATWHSEESKRDFIERLFELLLKLKDNKGYTVIFEIAYSLAEMTHFPDLENWEDTSNKITSARDAMARLKTELGKLNQQIQNERETLLRREEAYNERQKTIAANQSLEKLSQQLRDLVPKQGTQDGGYAFEKWFYELVNFFEIPARAPYKVDGRQIDGSLTIDGTTFLIETKFTNEQSSATDIDVFMSKITKKADNTMGIFISMSGFSSTAIKEASRDRTPMLLMDFSHIYNLVLLGVISLPDIIRRIKRHASQTGQAYLTVENFSG